jgi:DnaJ-class molecular chaperone
MCEHCEQSGPNRRDFLKLLAGGVLATTALHVVGVASSEAGSPCPQCAGRGRIEVVCPQCHGAGNFGPGRICSRCGGRGMSYERCPACLGLGQIPWK